jgi:hypothetical protein
VCVQVGLGQLHYQGGRGVPRDNVQARASLRLKIKKIVTLSSEAVLRIHDILVWIRGSMPLQRDPDPVIFVIDLQDANKKLVKKKVFLLITF